MSALGQKADICSAKGHVRFAPNSDREIGFPADGHVRITPKSGRVRRKPSCLLWANSGHSLNLFDYLVGAGEQRGRYGQAERFSGFEIDHQLVLGRGLYRKVGRLLTL
jgi:hypothetical protein